MRPVTFGTAGHIDHGKTTLVLALTGVDCDRLPEEKRRGITLALGFAPLADPAGELEISFIDVPGHERLVHTMIAGAGGIDRALLVVAADEGSMPQTREHLAILDLLAVRGGVVAVTKSDLLDAELLDLRIEEVRRALAGGPLAGAAIVPCSATTGAGLEALRDAILAAARSVVRDTPRHRPFRLPLDRVFTVPGVGTVATGTARWDRVVPGDELLALPSGRTVRVRGVQVHGGARPAGHGGQRVALSLAGASVAELPRGEQLLSPGPWRATTRVAVELRLLPGGEPLEEGQQLWLHLLATRVLARLERLDPLPLPAGSTGRAVLRLARGVFAAPGDHVVLRRPSPARTVGGGRVLDVDPPRLRRGAAALLAALPDPGRDRVAALEAWIVAAGSAGVELPVLAGRLGETAEALEAPLGRLLEAGRVALVAANPTIVIDRERVAAAAGRARELLAAAGTGGLPLAELLARVVPRQAARVREHYLDQLRRSGVLREVAGRVFAADLAGVEDPLTARLDEFYRAAGLAAPSPAEAALALKANPKVVEGLVRSLVDRQRLARVGGRWILHREALDEVAAAVRTWGLTSFDVGQFKERFGLTRKLAIPILEWLDSARVTRREGERRRVLPPRAGTRSGA